MRLVSFCLFYRIIDMFVQTGFLQGIKESLVGITAPYRPAFATSCGKLTSQSYNKELNLPFFLLFVASPTFFN